MRERRGARRRAVAIALVLHVVALLAVARIAAERPDARERWIPVTLLEEPEPEPAPDAAASPGAAEPSAAGDAAVSRAASPPSP